MVTVKDLVSHNPLMIDATLNKDSFLYRLSAKGHPDMVRDYDVVVTERERYISYFVQSILQGLFVGASVTVCLFSASKLGSSYWDVAWSMMVPGFLYGGLCQKVSPIEGFKFKADLYASYKTRFKILNPLHEIALGVTLPITVYAIHRFPNLGYLQGAAASFVAFSMVGSTFRFAFEKLFKFS